jgi:fatty-acyl-CoA synthase
MDTPERPDDADNLLRLAYGNEGPRQYLTRSRAASAAGRRCHGSSEVGVDFAERRRSAWLLGRAAAGVKILREDGSECDAAQLDAGGRLANAEAAIGEIVNVESTGFFEGYWQNDEATASRTRGGRYYTGDLGYRDADGFVYSPEATSSGSASTARTSSRGPSSRSCSAIPTCSSAPHGVPDAEAGDRAMAALALREAATFDPGRLPASSTRSPISRPSGDRRSSASSPSSAARKRTRSSSASSSARSPGIEGPDPLWWQPRGRRRTVRSRPI